MYWDAENFLAGKLTDVWIGIKKYKKRNKKFNNFSPVLHCCRRRYVQGWPKWGIYRFIYFCPFSSVALRYQMVGVKLHEGLNNVKPHLPFLLDQLLQKMQKTQKLKRFMRFSNPLMNYWPFLQWLLTRRSTVLIPRQPRTDSDANKCNHTFR